MNWSIVRLEVAYTENFPKGSAARAFVIRVPLDHAGQVDGDAIRRHPERATVRRFWPSEPDAYGVFKAGQEGWLLLCSDGRANDREYRLTEAGIHPEGQVIITEPDGTQLAFRVAKIRDVVPARGTTS